MWQREYLKNNLDKLKTEHIDKPIFRHPGQTLNKINVEKGVDTVNTGTMELYSDRLKITSDDNSKQDIFPLSDIAGFSVTKMMRILFSLKDGSYYEVRSNIPRTGMGYMMLYRYLTGRDYI